ncbi:MAG TPA: disulfide bond formation protein DsbD [Cytophagales bacterium]|nr:disulfide bond formation protein DsbD [Cytophagales bacterium]
MLHFGYSLMHIFGRTKERNNSMKRIFFLGILIFLLPFVLPAQILKPISWQNEIEPKSVNVGDTVEIHFNATIDQNWYLYSSDFDPELGPIIAEFNFEPHSDYELIGDITPIKPKRKYDDLWEGEVSIFVGTGKFVQKIIITGPQPVIIGYYSYQVCSGIDGKCINLEDDFNFSNIKVTATQKAEKTGGASDMFSSGNSDVIGNIPDDEETPTGILNPVEWEVQAGPSSWKEGDQVELIFEASIKKDWVLYTPGNDLNPGPIPASISFEDNDSFEKVGELSSQQEKTKYDDVFEGDTRYLENEGALIQTVLIRKLPPSISGTISFQVCNNESGKCIPLEYDFNIGSRTEVTAEVSSEKKGLLMQRDTTDAYSLLAFVILAFLGGLAALFTPCVFPMIPMTVSFFTGRAKNKAQGIRNALFYGFSIVLIYTLTGALLAPFMGPETANELATNWALNLIFFTIFIVFAISFFGAFDITLPSSFVNKMDRKADKGGFVGIFFMAFTLVLVSFSCTGPIAGSLLVESAGGLVLKPILGMFAFGMAFAIPFTLFAIFPEWLNSLPKSGGWLNSVKVALGFLELAFAFKFLSVADQAYHWGILDREVYLAIWIVVFTLMGLYLLGKIRLPHDSPLEKISVGRLLLAIVSFVFVVYLLPGMWGAPLKALAGYLPPMHTHDFNLYEARFQGGLEISEVACEPPKYGDKLHFPHGLTGYFDYEQAISCAREQNKPLFIDFTGHGCVNCREMEARVWSDPAALKRLREDFILVALYVDDKTELPESEWYTSDYDGKVKKTIGKQNADFQITRFENNAQPYYVILGHDEKPILKPKAYDLSVQNFIDYLEKAKEVYQSKHK